jgi:hypothetical protein
VGENDGGPVWQGNHQGQFHLGFKQESCGPGPLGR